MFILSITDQSGQRKAIEEQLRDYPDIQMDFAGSDENLPDLCRQTEPDILILCAQYEEVTARYLLRKLNGDDASALPERILVISSNPKSEPTLEVPKFVVGHYVTLSQLKKALTQDDFEDAEPVGVRSILHITDDRFLQKVVSDLIHKETPYDLTTASSGKQGLEMYQKNRPDLILTDWNLPDIDGIEICRKIKIELGDSLTEVALFSSFSDEHLIEDAFRVHAKAYIVKPVKPDMLIKKIRKILDPAQS